MQQKIGGKRRSSGFSQSSSNGIQITIILSLFYNQILSGTRNDKMPIPITLGTLDLKGFLCIVNNNALSFWVPRRISRCPFLMRVSWTRFCTRGISPRIKVVRICPLGNGGFTYCSKSTAFSYMSARDVALW